MVRFFTKIVVLLLLLITIISCSFKPHETEGRYWVNQMNADRNRNKSNESYFYTDNYNIYRYSIPDDETDICVQLAKEDECFIEDYVIYEEKIYYIKNYENRKYELCCMNYISGSEEVLLFHDDFLSLNDGKELGASEYPAVDVYGRYLFLAIVGKYEYMCPIEGDIKTDSFHLNTLFEGKVLFGDRQHVVYDGIVIEGREVSEDKYKINSVRDAQGYKILYANVPASIRVEDKQVYFFKNSYTNEIQYQVDEELLKHNISIFRDEEYKNSNIDESYLTVEDEKIIGVLSVSRHWAEYQYLSQRDLEKDVLFELDIETGESRKLFDTKNNLTKIIGYQNGVVYLVKNEKVYAREVTTKEETELFALPKGKDYIIDWQGDYLIIRDEDSYGENGNEIMVYKL